MRAVVESISEVGFQKTTANEITRRAGVTWGAVQHHFGGKDGILEAVLEESFERFAARLAAVPIEGASLEQRVSAFVDIAWQHFGRHRWRYTLEPVDGGTRVTETFDWSTALAPWFIEKIGYPCGNVSSIAPVDAGGGVFKVSCSSGHAYRAAPTAGRYRFKKWGGA